MTIQATETEFLLDMLEQSVRLMRLNDTLDQLSGLSAAREVVSQLRQRVADTGTIAGNSTGDITVRPDRSRDQQIGDALAALGVTGEVPERSRTAVTYFLDRAAAAELPLDDRRRLSQHEDVAAWLVCEAATGDDGEAIQAALDACDRLYANGDAWRELLRGPRIELVHALTSTEDRYVKMRQHSPFM